MKKGKKKKEIEVKFSKRSHERMQEFVDLCGVKMGDVVSQAVEEFFNGDALMSLPESAPLEGQIIELRRHMEKLEARCKELEKSKEDLWHQVNCLNWQIYELDMCPSKKNCEAREVIYIKNHHKVRISMN